jgi:hypothetical protein
VRRTSHRRIDFVLTRKKYEISEVEEGPASDLLSMLELEQYQY